MAGLSVYLGHASVANTYWYLEATPVLLRDIAAASEQLYREKRHDGTRSASLGYLREHLPRERAVSPHTVKTYANCFVLLVEFAADRLKRRPTDLEIEDLGTDMIMAFLDHVENGRGSCVRTRNGRLAAIRSFFRYIEYRIPACLIRPFASDRSLPRRPTRR
jgi:site-specific recombinase XerC